ncbi:MAG: hypothetical protein Q8K23_14320 [Sulfuritalea sp.]|nr:hypothetical protein [Sulfuritalea sp.]
MALGLLLAAAPAFCPAQSGPAPLASSDYAREMAATLRDMLVADRLGSELASRMFNTPEALEQAFAPQSAWGRKQMQAHIDVWNSAFATLLAGLNRRGELAQALSPAGLRIPLEPSLLEAAPEYKAIDNLLLFVDTAICDQKNSPPNCYIQLNLGTGKDQRVTLINLRIVASDGSLIAIPGKVQ